MENQAKDNLFPALLTDLVVFGVKELWVYHISVFQKGNQGASMSFLTRRRVEESAGLTFTEVEPDGWVTVHARGLGAVVSAASMSKLPNMALGYQLHSATFHVHVGPSLHKHTHHI